jgi:hypothetical protein
MLLASEATVQRNFIFVVVVLLRERLLELQPLALVDLVLDDGQDVVLDDLAERLVDHGLVPSTV